MEHPRRGNEHRVRAGFTRLVVPVLALICTLVPGRALAGSCDEGGRCRSVAHGLPVPLTRMRHCEALGEDGDCIRWTYATRFDEHFADLGAALDQFEQGISVLSRRLHGELVSNIYVAKVWTPDPAVTRNVVIIIAGQDVCGGVHNALTGQPSDYKWEGLGMTKVRKIASNAFAVGVMERFDHLRCSRRLPGGAARVCLLTITRPRRWRAVPVRLSSGAVVRDHHPPVHRRAAHHQMIPAAKLARQDVLRLMRATSTITGEIADPVSSRWAYSEATIFSVSAHRRSARSASNACLLGSLTLQLSK